MDWKVSEEYEKIMKMQLLQLDYLEGRLLDERTKLINYLSRFKNGDKLFKPVDKVDQEKKEKK